MATPPQAAPVKIAFKVPVTGLAPGKVMLKLPAGGPTLAVKVPPKPAPNAVVGVKQSTDGSKVVLKTRARDSDEDELLLMGSNGRAPPAIAKPKPTVTPPPKQVRRIETPPSSSSSSSEDEESDEETVSIFKLAKQKGLVPADLSQIEDEEDSPAVLNGAPPRPPVQRSFPSDIDAFIQRLRSKLTLEEVKTRMKDDNKTVSLGTSKQNYIDPRIVCAWCKKSKFPISKVFSSALQKKFPWALSAPEDFEF